MNDHERARVIKGLECCSTNRLRREDCEAMNCTYLALESQGCIHQLIRDALALLKEQEPIRPGLGIIHHDDGSKSYFLHCPIDGTTLDEGDRYCRKCGRAVKWE